MIVDEVLGRRVFDVFLRTKLEAVMRGEVLEKEGDEDEEGDDEDDDDWDSYDELMMPAFPL